jgi:hypothetical protein
MRPRRRSTPFSWSGWGRASAPEPERRKGEDQVVSQPWAQRPCG